MNFATRSYEKEFLDRDDIPFEDIKRNMQELEIINKRLGGHKITLDGVRRLRGSEQLQNIVVCEIGCGGGDNLKAIHEWSLQNGLNISFVGIDINPDCIEYAKENCKKLEVEWISSDYREVKFELIPDIIFSSLFCHHFTEDELRGQFRWMLENSVLGFFINDLQRNPIAYYSIKLLTKLFSRSWLVKNDAPQSVLRGFSRKELLGLMQQYNPEKTQLKWKWAFRWLLVVRK